MRQIRLLQVWLILDLSNSWYIDNVTFELFLYWVSENQKYLMDIWVVIFFENMSLLHINVRVVLDVIVNCVRPIVNLFYFPYLDIYGKFLDMRIAYWKKCINNNFEEELLQSHPHTHVQCSKLLFNKTRVSSIATKYQIRPIFAPIVMFISHYLLCLK